MALQPRLADDPEVARAKAWWNQHGRAIAGGLALGLAGVIGFNYWQSSQETQAEQASLLYDQLRVHVTEHKAAAEAEAAAKAAAEAEAKAAAAAEEEAEEDAKADDDAVAQSDEDAKDEDAKEEEDAKDDDAVAQSDDDAKDDDSHTDHGASIVTLAETLMAEYDSTPYAAHAAFALAKHSVDADDLARAEEVLEWVLLNSDDDSLRHVARLRLAAVLLAQDQAARATTLLDAVEDTAGFAARYDELRGDALRRQGDVAAAREAYQRGLQAWPSTLSGRALLQLKLDNLGE